MTKQQKKVLVALSPDLLAALEELQERYGFGVSSVVRYGIILAYKEMTGNPIPPARADKPSE